MIRALLLLVSCWGLSAQPALFTAHADNSRTGYIHDSSIVPSQVVSGRFGLVGSYLLDGDIFGQSLYLPGPSVAGLSLNILIVVTMHCSIYALDADHSGVVFWSRLGICTPRTSYPDSGPLFYGREIGCLSAPVADIANGWLFAVCHTSVPSHILYKLNLLTGATIASTTISGQVVGTGDVGHGDTTSGANLLFYPAFELQRSALTLANNRVYITFASYADARPWHGWAFAYDESLNQTAILCTSPNDWGAGLWGSSGGLSVDGSGNLYMLTGNGAYNGTTAFSFSIIKLSSTLAIVDWYAPTDATIATLNANDSDFSSGRAMLIPGTTWVVGGAKDFNVYAVDTTCMGHQQGSGSGCPAAQVFPTNAGGVLGDRSGIYGGAFYNNHAFFPNVAGKIYRFDLSGTTFNQTPTTSTNSYAFPGAQLSISGDGTDAGGILWAVTVPTSAVVTPTVGVIRAFDMSLNEIMSAPLGTISKFSVAVIANKKAYISTLDHKIQVYAVLNSSQSGGAMTLRGNGGLR